MTGRITQLTAEQQAELATIRDEWIAHGLSCNSANREAAIAGVNQAYRAAGLQPPTYVIWLDSPLAGVYGAWYAEQLFRWLQKNSGGQVGGQVWGQVRGQVRGQVWDQVGGQVWDQVWDQVGGQVWDQVGGQVWGQVRGQVWGQVGGQVWGQVGGQVWDQVGGQVGGQVWDQVGGQVWGQVWDQVRGQVERHLYNSLNGYTFDLGWLSFYDTFRRFGLECCEKLSGLMQVAQNAGWWFPMRDVVVLTERPTAIHRDPQGRLHCEDGPAVAYPDGWGVYAWHGTRVPADLIENSWSVKEIFAERNSEIRRCAIEKIGWDVFIQESGLEKVASAPDPGNSPHHLVLYDLPEELADMYDAEARVLLCVNGTVERDGTRRRFGLPVPAHHTDPVEAAADLYGWPVAAYRQLEVRR